MSSPVKALEVLPNGATVLDCLQSSGGQWVVFAVWVRNGRSEYVVWYLDADTLGCDCGDYSTDAGVSWARFVKRAS